MLEKLKFVLFLFIVCFKRCRVKRKYYVLAYALLICANFIEFKLNLNGCWEFHNLFSATIYCVL